jgi:hypothetical protein
VVPATFGFDKALYNLKLGKDLTRAGWDKDLCIALLRPSVTSKMAMSYIYMQTPDGLMRPWQMSQADLLAEDWEIQE